MQAYFMYGIALEDWSWPIPIRFYFLVVERVFLLEWKYCSCLTWENLHLHPSSTLVSLSVRIELHCDVRLLSETLFL